MPVGTAEYSLRLSAFRLRIFLLLSFFPSSLPDIAVRRTASFHSSMPAIHAEATLANASTGICLLQFSMDHRIKSGGDDF